MRHAAELDYTVIADTIQEEAAWPLDFLSFHARSGFCAISVIACAIFTRASAALPAFVAHALQASANVGRVNHLTAVEGTQAPVQLLVKFGGFSGPFGCAFLERRYGVPDHFAGGRISAGCPKAR